MNSDLFFLYGPPGSGKSHIGSQLAERLRLPFTDLDAAVEAASGQTVEAIFKELGESGFRSLESQVLREILQLQQGVVSLGGGTLLDDGNRRLVEMSGSVLCLNGAFETMLGRLASKEPIRPLLAGDLQEKLAELLDARSDHYSSFQNQLNVDNGGLSEIVSHAQKLLGAYHLSAMGVGCDVRIVLHGLEELGEAMRRRGMTGPLVLVSDENVGRLHGEAALQALQQAGFSVSMCTLPAGEGIKSLDSLQKLWQVFLAHGLDRSSTVVALGGGVITDLAGFAAATYLRGISWVCVPASLMGMVDAGIGGKTGIDLADGKNLVGAFHAPRLVMVDPDLLGTLPEIEQRNGLAEVVKHGLIGDAGLLEICRGGLEGLRSNWQSVVRRAAAVKIGIIEADPYERGVRSSLNLGHTLGHAIEKASDYQVRHGEAVSIGLVCAARLSAAAGIAGDGLVDDIQVILRGVGLPVALPKNLDKQLILKAMRYDKKRQGGKMRFVLLSRPGDVRWHQELEEDLVLKTLEEL